MIVAESDGMRRAAMGKVLMGAAVSVDGFIADDQDGVGALFD